MKKYFVLFAVLFGGVILSIIIDKLVGYNVDDASTVTKVIHTSFLLMWGFAVMAVLRFAKFLN